MNRFDHSKRSRLHFLILAFIVALSVFTVPLVVRSAHAAGTLFVSPASQPTLPIGSTLTVQVNVSSIDEFDTWDISVQTNPSVITPTLITTAGDIFGSPTEFVNCVNGVGTGCTFTDTQGIAHSAATSSSGLPASGNGFLFTITYQAVGSGYSDITIPPITSANQILYQGSQVVHTTSDGVYGTAPTNLPVANFTFSPTTPVTGDSVTFNASSSSDPNAGARIVKYDWTYVPVTGCLNPLPFPPCENITATPILVHQFTLANQYVVTLVVTDSLGLSSRQKILQLNVAQAPDFGIAAVPNTPKIERGTSVTSTVTLASLYGFSGTVTLTATVSPLGRFSPRVTLNATSLILSSGGTATSTLTMDAGHSIIGDGVYDIVVTATSGSITRFTLIILLVTKT